MDYKRNGYAFSVCILFRSTGVVVITLEDELCQKVVVGTHAQFMGFLT